MTHPDPGPAETLRAAASLEESMSGLRDEMAALRQRSKRDRKWIVGLAVSLALDIVLSVVVAVVAVQASQANSLAQQNRQTQVLTCEAGNQARSASVSLWTYVLDATAKEPENQTPQRKQQIEQFRTYMQNAYAQRDCTKAGA
ncbi:hypothetical protein AB5J62_33475 [Amycolatopsis sp. cg5]|uniref:hypothetical protein n=1 Tax=Amycolatopsis sp. cg5 TaxID=3238802 RepID=UPI003523EB67